MQFNKYCKHMLISSIYLQNISYYRIDLSLKPCSCW